MATEAEEIVASAPIGPESLLSSEELPLETTQTERQESTSLKSKASDNSLQNNVDDGNENLKNPFTGSPVSMNRYRVFSSKDVTTPKKDTFSENGNGRHRRFFGQHSRIHTQESRVVDTLGGTTEADSKIEDLLNMLECPVCLDTADHPPIYQCPEGHLLCESCNQKLTHCPQCGHALLNSRNRTAEGLAVKLQMLRGSQGRSLNDQSITISVSEPKKLKRGIFAPVVYTINAKVRQETRNSNYSVTREYKDFLTLHNYLHNNYIKEGVIVPPPPKPASIKTVASVAALAPDEDLEASSASQVLGSRCVALDRYLKRLVRHPVIKKDPNFRSFFQEKPMSKSLRMKTSWGTRAKDMVTTFRSRMSVKEKDPWFATRKNQLNVSSKQLNQMKVTLADMSNLKLKLHHESDQFRNDLVLMLVSRSAERENSLGMIINEVLDSHRTMSNIFEQQSEADKLIVELATDYGLMVESAMEALAQRRNLQMELEKVEKKEAKVVKSKGNEVAAIEGNADDEGNAEELRNRFEDVSRMLRRELEHFDVVMRDEFEIAFTAYKMSYWKSLRDNRNIFNRPDGMSDKADEFGQLHDVELYPSLPYD